MARFTNKLREKGEFSAVLSDLDILEKLEFFRDGKPTFGSYLLFVTEYCPISDIQIGRFKSDITIIDSISRNSDLFSEVTDIIAFIKKHLMIEYIITGEPQRTERFDYPLDAIREVVINSIHRDYCSTADSIVKIFDNKIEFYNPGKLPEEITIENLLSGNYKSNPRNKLIADICKDMRIIEKYGSGIGRIRSYFKDEELPEPKFELISDGFQVTVFGEDFVGHQETHQENSGKALELVSLMSNKSYTTKELMDLLELNDIVNFRILYRTPAIQAGYITMLYPDNPKHRNQRYFLTEKGKATAGK